MNEKQVFIEQRESGDYAIRKAGSKRASAVETTQLKAIARAKKMIEGAVVHVERVRNVGTGKRDRWRKI